MSLSRIQEVLNKRSLAAQFVSERQEDSRITTTTTRGIDNSGDSLIGTETNSRLYDLKQVKDGAGKFVLIEGQNETFNGVPLLDESQTPVGTTLSNLQRALNYFKQRETNNDTRTTSANGQLVSVAKSNLKDPIGSAVKEYLGNDYDPSKNRSSNFADLYRTISNNARDRNSPWFIPKPDDLVPDHLKPPPASLKQQANPVTNLFNSFYGSAANLYNYTRELFSSSKDDSYYQVPDEKPYEKNKELAKASESTASSSLASSETKKPGPHCKKDLCRLDSRLKALAASAGVSLDSYFGLDNRTLSKILLNRGVSPFLMLGIFENMGKNFLGTLGLLRKHGKEHLFSSAIVKGLDVSSSSGAEIYAMQLTSEKSFIA